MRISDWSSDVCSSDLEALQALEVPSQTIGHRQRHHSQQARHLQIALVMKLPTRCLIDRLAVAFIAVALVVWRHAHHRSEERRVGKECVGTCRSGWSPCN